MVAKDAPVDPSRIPAHLQPIYQIFSKLIHDCQERAMVRFFFLCFFVIPHILLLSLCNAALLMTRRSAWVLSLRN